MSTDQTPALARATKEVAGLWLNEEVDFEKVARAAVSAALRDPDGDVIAWTLAQHQIVPEAAMQCSCDRWPHDENDGLVLTGFAAHQADAVRAAILGEAS